MKFNTEHRFGGSVNEVVAILLDPAFHRGLQLPDVAPPEVVEHRAGGDGPGDRAVLRCRYRYTGELDPMARRLLGDRELTWVQGLSFDVDPGTGTGIGKGRLSVDDENEPRQMRGLADVTVEPDGDGRSVRRIEGEVEVDIPVVGRMAERMIVPALVARLDIEAEALEDRLRAG